MLSWRRVCRRTAAAVLLTSSLLAGGRLAAAPVAQGVPLGSGRLYPSLGAELRHETNFFRTPDSAGPDGRKLPALDTWVSVLRPRLSYSLFEGQRAARAYRLTYGAEIGTVYGSRNDDYVDHQVNLSANWERTLANRFRLEYEFLHEHDRRGSGDPTDVSRSNFQKHPDLWRSNRFEGGWSLGRPGGKTLMDLWATHYARRYINNDQESRNNDRLTLNATVSRLLAPKTRALVQINFQDIDYINQPPGVVTLDSREWRLYGGVLWQVSPKTSINGRGGWLAKDFRAAERNDISDFGWELDVRWRPQLERMILDLSTKRLPRESADGFSNAVVISTYELSWIHYLVPSRHYYELGAYYTSDDYAGEDRIDHRMRLRAGLYGQLRRRFTVGLSLEHQERDSPLALARYDNTVVQLTIDFRL